MPARTDAPGKRTTVLFCGHGFAGKDTSAEILAQVTFLRYAGSTSRHALPYIARCLGLTEEEAWRTRHERRLEWRALCDTYRSGDPTRLVREGLHCGEIITGVRAKVEIEAIRALRVVDHTVWVQNDRVPVDPTMGYGREYCDHVLSNNGTMDQLASSVLRLAMLLNLPLRPVDAAAVNDPEYQRKQQ